MALDRQKILSELGSVMNQLKSTDCGCMGKLFGDSGQNVSRSGNLSNCGGYRQGCCGHHYGCSPTNNTQNFHRPCMGQCNPPKLYADTYNYLTDNLMQPTINEVYNDLKDITPANTIMNNPVPNQMSNFSKENFNQPIVNSKPTFQMDNQNFVGNFNSGDKATTNNSNFNNMNRFGGMGPQIMNMLGESNNAKPNVVKSTTFTNKVQHNYNENSPFAGQPQHANYIMQQQPNLESKANSQPISNLNTNPGVNHQATPTNHHHHGEHAQGIAKFNQMFPGVMKNGDLGFDPMAIAIQMNPANQKQVALDTIHKMMSSNNGLSTYLNTNDNTGGVDSKLNTSSNNNQYNTQPNQIQGNAMPNGMLSSNFTNQPPKQSTVNNIQLNNQQVTPSQQVVEPSTGLYGAYPAEVNQNVYTAVTSSNVANPQQQLLQYQQPINEANTGDVTGQIKEPLLPADTTKFVTSKHDNYHYNTLGQPIEMLPAKMYHSPEPALPQTLSPQTPVKTRNDFTKYSNVKATMSKTSLIGNKSVGRTPSRNQLQHLYSQYKSFQSNTHQNIKDPSNKNISHSDGRLNMSHLAAQQMPVESLGGDTVATNQLKHEKADKVEHEIGQIGDAPNIKRTGNVAEQLSPAPNRKYRNGLQDIVYTSYPTSTAWSFHGDGRASPYSAGCRYRDKI